MTDRKQLNKTPDSRRIELLPPSFTMRVGNRRLTLSWRPRKPVPRLLTGLLHRSWRSMFGATLRVTVAAAAVCAAWNAPALAAAPPANTLPTGWNVAAGGATIAQNGNTLNINQSTNQAIVNFNSFSIGANAMVDISQPSAAAAFLARVTGSDPSLIYGMLKANGTVALINQNGILVGPTGVVDVARFIASTLNISDNDFLAGRLNFANGGNAGNVENQGTIKSATGGSVYLVGVNVDNSGIIRSPSGEILLAAGQTVQLVDTATPGVSVNVTGAAGKVTNLGTITAEAGRIGIAAGLISNSGELNASSVVNEGGRIFLRASQNLTTSATSKIAADGPKGGSVVLYSDGAAYIDGDVSAVGAPGRGGYVETSGRQSLDVMKVPTVGSGGEWLIDPNDLTVVATGESGINDNGGVITSTGGSALIEANTIVDQLNLGVSVTLATGSGGTQAGDITINSAINKTSGSAAVLTLNADNNIVINADISSSSNALGLTLNSNYRDASTGDHTVNINGATIKLNGGILNASEGSQGSGNGNIAINDGAKIDLDTGGTLNAGNVNVSAGGTLTGGYTSSVLLQGTLTNRGAVTLSNAMISAASQILNYGQFSTSNVSINAIGGFTNFASGALTLNYLSNFRTGSFNNQGTVHADGTNGYVTFENGFSNSGNMTLTGQILSNGSISNSATGIITLGSSDQSVQIGGSGLWTNDGSITMSGSNISATITSSGGVINNADGTIAVNGSNDSLTIYGGSYTGSVSVAGGTLTLNGAQLSGAMQAGNDGNLVISNSDIGSGASFTGSGNGAMEWNGNVSLNTDLELGAGAPALTLNGEDVAFVLKGSDDQIRHALTTRNQVTLLGNVQLDPFASWINYGTVNLQEAMLTLMTQASFTNQNGGTVNFNGPAGLNIGSTATASNLFGGTFNMNNSSSISGDVPLLNAGIVNKNGVGDQNLAIRNDESGILNVNAGNLIVGDGMNGNGGVGNFNGDIGVSGAALENFGTIVLASGASITGDVNNEISGTLTGSGAIEGTLTNAGTVAPGGIGGIGTLTVQNYTQTQTGKLLTDYASAFSYDSIAVEGGAVTLDGVLQTSLLDGFVPDGGKTLMLFGGTSSISGYFRNVLGDVIGTGSDKRMLKVRTDGNSIVMSMLGGDDLHFITGFGDNAQDWSRQENWQEGYIPTAVDRVHIDGGNVADVSGYNYTVDQLAVAGGATLNLVGGNLTVTSSTALDGTVNVPNGFLVLGGTLTGGGALNLTGPTSSIADLPTGTVSINDALSTLTVNLDGGNLNLAGLVRISELDVNGGTVTGAAGSKLNVTESFHQTDGSLSLADAALSQDRGTLAVGNITADNLVLEAQAGAVTQNAGTGMHVKKQLIVSATNGITLDSVDNQIAAFAAHNRFSGDIVLVNRLNLADTAAVALTGVVNEGGNVSVNNTGGMVTRAIGSGADFLADGSTQTDASAALAVLGIEGSDSGIVQSDAGSVTLTTHSPLTIGSGGVTAAGNIVLSAGNSGSNTDNLIINGLVTSGGGNITLFAGNNMSVNANIFTAPPGQAIFTVSNGVVTYAPGVSVTDVTGTHIPAGTVITQVVDPIVAPEIEPSIAQIVTSATKAQTQGVLFYTPKFDPDSRFDSGNSSTQTTGGAPGTFGGDDIPDARGSKVKKVMACT